MKIWIDADACPNPVKKIIFRASIRTKIHAILVANQRLEVPQSEFIHMEKVASGFDVADNAIIEQVDAGDLIITADIPLAAAVIKKQCVALDPRGILLNENNIQQRLSMRNLMEQLRDTGLVTGGPKTFSQRDIKNFANQLDAILAKCI